MFKGHAEDFFANLSQLSDLDGQDRLGDSYHDSDFGIPGLGKFLKYLLSDCDDSLESESLKESSNNDLKTPKIDRAMELFKQRQWEQNQQPVSSSSADTSVIPSVTDTEMSPTSSRFQSVPHTGQDFRLEKLEQQIAELLNKAQRGVVGSGSNEDESNTSTSTSGPPSNPDGSNTSTSTARPKVTIDVPEKDDNQDISKDGDMSGHHLTNRSKKSSLPRYRKSPATSRARKDHLSKQGSENKGQVSPLPDQSSTQAAVVDCDNKIHNDIQDIMQELEQERVRRWKAEAAMKKVMEQMQTLANKVKDETEMKDVAIEAITRLKQSFMNERETKLRLHEENESLKKQLQEAVEQLSNSKKIQEEQAKALRQFEEMTMKEEKEKMKQQTHDHKKLQEALMRGAALSREVDLLKSSCDSQKVQIQSLQSLLASREQEHREEFKNRYSLGSKEMQTAVQEEVKRLEQEHQLQMKQRQDKIEELNKEYKSLEDEFREALQICSSRYEQLKAAFETICKENASNKAALMAAQRLHEKSTKMIAELTSMVKEQKDQISELAKAKQEYREKINILEAHAEEARKRMVQLELLKQESIKLKSQIYGQESVIEGLRAERKLWGQELAHQGVSLAQDRGGLEAKIEAQKSELALTKKQLERETDSLKIKTKMLEDQTETIRKLKEGIEERDTDIKKCRQESLKMQQDLEKQLAEERDNNQDTNNMLEKLRERKDNLKQQVANLQAELDNSKEAYNTLRNEWKERSLKIGQMEQQVQEMKELWEKKELKLTLERDKALNAANLAIDRLKAADNAFCKQLEDKVKAFQDQITKIENEKKTELYQAHMKVRQVEDEMRMLLQENQAAKKAMEDKVKCLAQAMTELHMTSVSDLYQ